MQQVSTASLSRPGVGWPQPPQAQPLAGPRSGRCCRRARPRWSGRRGGDLRGRRGRSGGGRTSWRRPKRRCSQPGGGCSRRRRSGGHRRRHRRPRRRRCDLLRQQALRVAGLEEQRERRARQPQRPRSDEEFPAAHSHGGRRVPPRPLPARAPFHPPNSSLRSETVCSVCVAPIATPCRSLGHWGSGRAPRSRGNNIIWTGAGVHSRESQWRAARASQPGRPASSARAAAPWRRQLTLRTQAEIATISGSFQPGLGWANVRLGAVRRRGPVRDRSYHRRTRPCVGPHSGRGQAPGPPSPPDAVMSPCPVAVVVPGRRLACFMKLPPIQLPNYAAALPMEELNEGGAND